MHHTYGDLRKYKTPSEQLCLSPESEHECGLTLHGTQVSSGSMRQMAQVARAEVGYGTDRPAPLFGTERVTEAGSALHVML